MWKGFIATTKSVDKLQKLSNGGSWPKYPSRTCEKCEREQRYQIKSRSLSTFVTCSSEFFQEKHWSFINNFDLNFSSKNGTDKSFESSSVGRIKWSTIINYCAFMIWSDDPSSFFVIDLPLMKAPLKMPTQSSRQ